MSKGAWFVARLASAGASAPRTTGADGRALRRPWRIASPAAVRQAQRERAARPQPWWPRPAGMLLVGVAAVAALRPIAPVPRQVAGAVATAPAPCSGLAPEPWDDTAALPFAWPAPVPAGAVSLVLLDAGYREVARREGLGGTAWTADAALRESLADGATYHWYVLATDGDAPQKSRLQSFAWRRAEAPVAPRADRQR